MAAPTDNPKFSTNIAFASMRIIMVLDNHPWKIIQNYLVSFLEDLHL